jgi:hypothetical protein
MHKGQGGWNIQDHKNQIRTKDQESNSKILEAKIPRDFRDLWFGVKSNCKLFLSVLKTILKSERKYTVM